MSNDEFIYYYSRQSERIQDAVEQILRAGQQYPESRELLYCIVQSALDSLRTEHKN